MSDDDQELDMDSDGEDGWDDGMQDMAGGTAVKRAHHNALERKRRVHIKDSFHGLRDSIPAIQGDKASRAVILTKLQNTLRPNA
ncbi:PREDICTED: protein max-like [Priapulus caudatus]|uniref:Protein max-like n=1 Tax=Priapulus caudatus TaxID=37621 RepID=A0ABM1EB15_PRICU|nr:PREDICTED: protein max-like [Priapulus caudatus]XP_014669387.1 PREDICTED: protein max-like [Priapulus caudatus]